MKRYVKASDEIDIRYIKNKDEHFMRIEVDYFDTKNLILNKKRYEGKGIDIFKAIADHLDLDTSGIRSVDTDGDMASIAEEIALANGTGRDVIVPMWNVTDGHIYINREANNGAIETVKV